MFCSSFTFFHTMKSKLYKVQKLKIIEKEKTENKTFAKTLKSKMHARTQQVYNRYTHRSDIGHKSTNRQQSDFILFKKQKNG